MNDVEDVRLDCQCGIIHMWLIEHDETPIQVLVPGWGKDGKCSGLEKKVMSDVGDVR